MFGIYIFTDFANKQKGVLCIVDNVTEDGEIDTLFKECVKRLQI